MPRSGALPAAQASFIALPDELLGGVLRRAWADRPRRPAAEEVRAAADLALVCRRVRELLRTLPLPLDLDFSAAPLSAAQRCWLLEPAQAGRVEAAKFYVAFEADEVALWEQPVLKNFLALHGGTLLRLSGVPLRLVACVSQEDRPAVDLSGLRLTALGVDCCDVIGLLHMDDNAGAKCLWLWPERLPGALEELHLLGLDGNWPGFLAWAPQPMPGLAGRLPRLHTLRVTSVEADLPLGDDDTRETQLCVYETPLLESSSGLRELKVGGADIDNYDDLFGQVRSLRIVAVGCVRLWNDQDDVATFVDRLCPAGLQAAALCAGKIPAPLLDPEGAQDVDVIVHVHEIVRALILRCGDRFAVEVGVPHNPQGWAKAQLCRLAWRRWPAPGAPDLPAARAAHERARAWVADAEQWVRQEEQEHMF